MIGFNADVAELIQHTLPDAKRKTGNFRGHIVVFRFIQNQFNVGLWQQLHPGSMRNVRSVRPLRRFNFVKYRFG